MPFQTLAVRPCHPTNELAGLPTWNAISRMRSSAGGRGRHGRPAARRRRREHAGRAGAPARHGRAGGVRARVPSRRRRLAVPVAAPRQAATAGSAWRRSGRGRISPRRVPRSPVWTWIPPCRSGGGRSASTWTRSRAGRCTWPRSSGTSRSAPPSWVSRPAACPRRRRATQPGPRRRRARHGGPAPRAHRGTHRPEGAGQRRAWTATRCRGRRSPSRAQRTRPAHRAQPPGDGRRVRRARARPGEPDRPEVCSRQADSPTSCCWTWHGLSTALPSPGRNVPGGRRAGLRRRDNGRRGERTHRRPARWRGARDHAD